MKGNNAFAMVSAMTLVLFVSNAYLVAADNVSDMNSICSRVPSHSMIASGTNCSAYYICHNGTANARQCPEKLYFHKDHQACLPVPSASCNKAQEVNVCMNQQIGTLVAMADTCRNFTFCGSNGPNLLSCFEGYLFEPKSQVCVPASDYTCTIKQSICNYIADGVLFGSTTDCAVYSSCKGGEIKDVRTCFPEYFNVETSKCINKYYYLCPQLQHY